MDFSLREWLLIIGAVLIVGVLVDGYRRARRNKKGSLKLAIDKNLKFRDEDRVDYFNGELPNGSARTVRRPQDQDEGEGVTSQPGGAGVEPNAEQDLTPEPLYAQDTAGGAETGVGQSESIRAEVADDPLFEAPLGEEAAVQQEPASADSDAQRNAEGAGRVVEEVIVINAFAADAKPFSGSELMEVILACGMRYGDLQIFHRHEQGEGKGAVQFSMANALKPGYFDLNDIDNFSTPGVSFFMSLPGPTKSMQAFDYMLETAQCVVNNLGGELRDEQHSTLTSQTIEHARQKIRDYERRQLSLLQ